VTDKADALRVLVVADETETKADDAIAAFAARGWTVTRHPSCTAALSMGDPAMNVAVVYTRDEDPLVDLSALWSHDVDVPVILLGHDVSDELRAAALDAGVAYVGSVNEAASDLVSFVRLVNQPRRGPAQIVRSMCQTMASISRCFATATDPTVLNATVHELRELFRAPIVSIMLFEDDEREGPLRVVAHVGLGPSALYAASARDGVAERVARANTPQIILRSAERRSQFSGVAGRAEITASMCVPIFATGTESGRARGVVNVARTDSLAMFTPRDLDVCTSIARLIGEYLMILDARELQSKLEQRMQAVERLSTIGEIAGGIAHEVANPIACVRANVDTIIEYMKELAPVLAAADDDPTIAQIVDDLPSLMCETWEGLARAEEVVRQMKALVRLNGSAGGHPVRERVSCASLIEETLRLLRPRLRRPIKVDIDKDLEVRANRVDLSRVLVNLMVNAADACEERRQSDPTPGLEPEVRVSVSRDGAFAVFRVVDEGAGMTPEVMRRIFMPLFTTKPGERGTGLGLSIVRRVVADHGGTVRVQSTPGVGTAFTFTVPLAETIAAPAPEHDGSRFT
jgi:signal transduction histidine kinase